MSFRQDSERRERMRSTAGKRTGKATRSSKASRAAAADDGNLSELMSELSRVDSGRYEAVGADASFRSSGSSSIGGRGGLTQQTQTPRRAHGAGRAEDPAEAEVANVFSMQDVLSPDSTRRLYEVTGSLGRDIGRSSGSVSAFGAGETFTGELMRDLAEVCDQESSAVLGNADDSELDAVLHEDPCVLSYEDNVVLRSRTGSCATVVRPKRKGQREAENLNISAMDVSMVAPLREFPKGGRTSSISSQETSSSVAGRAPEEMVTHFYTGRVDGNPTELASEFTIVGNAIRSQSGVVKHGDVVSLLSRPRGRFLGIVDPANDPLPGMDDLDLGDDDVDEADDNTLGQLLEDNVDSQWKVVARRKQPGRRENWVVVQVPNTAYDRERERIQRVAAKAASLGPKSKLNPEMRKPKDIRLAVRSSDTILLRSVHLDQMYLCGVNGKLRICRFLNNGLTPPPKSCQWSIVKVPAPFTPLWSRERKLLNDIYSESSEVADENAGTAVLNKERKDPSDDAVCRRGGNSRAELEMELVDAMLFAMQGIESELVVCKDVDVFSVNSAAVNDKSFVHLAGKMLQVCSNYVTASQFVLRRARPEYGRVSHALAAAMRSLLKEYEVLLAQLENQRHMQQLSLQKLWFYIQPSLRTLEVLAQVAKRTGVATGGALLNVVHGLATRGGDAKARAVYSYLVQHATVPYLEMLELWVYHGVIRDPYHEFMVRVDEDTTKRTLRDDFNARYWDARYTLRETRLSSSSLGQDPRSGDAATVAASRPEASSEASFNVHVPFFLNRLAEKILTTGKYLNVVRECGRWVTNECAEHIPYSDESHAYDKIISRAHDFASRKLLSLLLEEEQLIARLRSLKHYFLLDQGDFFVHFMDIAHVELQKKVSEIAVPRLQSLLEMCLRVRNVNDPFQEDLACELVPYALIQHVEAIHEFANGTGTGVPTVAAPATAVPPGSQDELHGIDTFTLDFKVRWPLSLVLSRQALTKYQLIFRHLFFCKHVERQLCNTWLSHQTTKDLGVRSALGPEFCLRQRMLHFLQNFEYYVMFEVLEPRWHQLEQRLAAVKTVDELMKHHAEFLDTCLRECLLTHQGLLKTLAKIMTTCLLFAEQIDKFTSQLELDEAQMMEAAGAANPRLSTRGEPRAKAKQGVRQVRINTLEAHIHQIVAKPSYRAMIERSQTTFDSMLGTFMDDLLREATHGEYHSHLTNLCTRLDFNGYYAGNS